jgi:hypothetical protein
MVSVAARIGALLGQLPHSCWPPRAVSRRSGPPALALLMIIPSETPARRLRQLIQAWIGRAQADASHRASMTWRLFKMKEVYRPGRNPFQVWKLRRLTSLHHL